MQDDYGGGGPHTGDGIVLGYDNFQEAMVIRADGLTKHANRSRVSNLFNVTLRGRHISSDHLSTYYLVLFMFGT